jgi:hypothetical protein
VFLTGYGAQPHVFDNLASAFADRFRGVGLTRLKLQIVLRYSERSSPKRVHMTPELGPQVVEREGETIAR